MTQWYSPNELGTKWGLVSASHQLGSIIVLVLGAHLSIMFGWRSIFIVPAAVAIVLAVFLFDRLKLTKSSGDEEFNSKKIYTRCALFNFG
jgi:sugar phosphate permease